MDKKSHANPLKLCVQTKSVNGLGGSKACWFFQGLTHKNINIGLHWACLPVAA
jgi:hypothetical protein